MTATRKYIVTSVIIVSLYEGRHYTVKVFEIVCVIAITYNVITNKTVMVISEIYNNTYEIKLMAISSTSLIFVKTLPA